VFKLLLKAIIFGVFPILVFVMITSRTSIIGGIQSFVVLTGSMEPSLPVGSIVFTKKFPSYRQKDVVAFKTGNVIVTHRIIDFETKNNIYYYKTQGDANNNPDSPMVSQDQILGRAFFLVPYLGKLALFLKTIPGFLLLIGFPAIIYIILEIINIKKEMTKEIEKKLLEKMKKG